MSGRLIGDQIEQIVERSSRKSSFNASFTLGPINHETRGTYSRIGGGVRSGDEALESGIDAKVLIGKFVECIDKGGLGQFGPAKYLSRYELVLKKTGCRGVASRPNR